MKTALQYIIFGLVVIGATLAGNYMLQNNPCDEQCKIEGIQARIDKECYEGLEGRELCLEFYNNQLAELSTKSH